MRLSVDIFAVSDFKNRHGLPRIVNFIHDAVASYADPPTDDILQLAAP
jgi:hypothetical protein